MHKASQAIFSDDALVNIMNKDFSGVDNKKANEESYQFKLFDENEFINIKFYLTIEITSGSTYLNVTEIAEAWYITSLNQSRTQVVEFVGGENEQGIAVEAIVYGDEEYVVFQNGSNLICMIQNYSSFPTLYYTYYSTMFITPDYDDYTIVWGPRLIDIYYATSNETTVVLGLDSFTEDLVIFVAYQNATFTETLFVHEINYDKFAPTYVTVPSHVDCSTTETDTPLFSIYSILSA